MVGSLSVVSMLGLLWSGERGRWNIVWGSLHRFPVQVEVSAKFGGPGTGFGGLGGLVLVGG